MRGSRSAGRRRRPWRAGLAAALLGLTGCAVDPDQAHICRSLIDALEPAAADTEVLPREAAESLGYDVKVAFRARDRDGRPREGWIACRFVDDETGWQRFKLAAVASDRRGELAPMELFWLEAWLRIYDRSALDPRRAGALAEPVAAPAADDRWLPLLYLGQQAINALALGGIYALLALAFNLVYGIIGKINFAFGELNMIGAMLTAVLSLALAIGGLAGWPVALTLVLGAILVTVGAAGWSMERLVFRPLRTIPGHAPLIAAIGLSIALQEGVRLLQGAGDFWLPADFSLSFVLARTPGFAVVASWKQVAILLLTASVLGGLAWLLRREFGLAYRACCDDVAAAALMGVNVDRTVAGTFVLGGALAGLAGFVMIEYYGVANFFMGFLTGFKALTAAILGGIGSLPGAVLGGALIALLETFWSGYLGSTYKDVAVFALLALVLIFRPSGLLGRSVPALGPRGR